MKVSIDKDGNYTITGRIDPSQTYKTDKSKMLVAETWQNTGAVDADGKPILAMLQMRVPLPKQNA